MCSSDLLGFIGSYFGLIYAHEAGHAFFARHLGYRPRAVYLYFGHGLCVYEGPTNEKHECIIAWGGVVAQLAIALPLIVAHLFTPIGRIPVLMPIVMVLGYANAFVAAINLVPSANLDGQKAWRLIPILLAERKNRNT